MASAVLTAALAGVPQLAGNAFPVGSRVAAIDGLRPFVAPLAEPDRLAGAGRLPEFDGG